MNAASSRPIAIAGLPAMYAGGRALFGVNEEIEMVAAKWTDKGWAMSTASEKARKFLEEEKAFRLGALVTESPHPKTMRFGETVRADLKAGLRMLFSVDEDIPPAAGRAFGSPEFQAVRDAMVKTLRGGGRIFLISCGAKGRLNVLLEAAWRRFWRRLRRGCPASAGRVPDLEDRVVGLISGGDFALIRSVESFEDYAAFGRRQLREAGVRAGDLAVGPTGGGDTPFVIGALWEALAAGARPFFVYNNPAAILGAHLERSRQVLEDERIVKLELATGPMALTGSTRMQCATIDILVLGAALELALEDLLAGLVPPPDWDWLGLGACPALEYAGRFRALTGEMSSPVALEALSGAVEMEAGLYARKGLMTYMADRFLFDVLTDTTERTPTFMVPPFRRRGETVGPRPWAFVKNPVLPTEEAWTSMLGREPRGLTWDAAVYAEMDAPAHLRERPPALDRREVCKFMIGNEPDPSRTDAVESGLMMVLAGEEIRESARPGHPFRLGFARHATAFDRTAALLIGSGPGEASVDASFRLPCSLPCSPLDLWAHLGVKLALNAMSTAAMARVGRIEGNYMVWVSPTNKKLVDRGTRLVSLHTGLDYEAACFALHEAIDDVARRQTKGEEAPSPVVLAIMRQEKRHK